jgi:hypothetical protein
MPDIGEIQVPRQQRFASLTDQLCAGRQERPPIPRRARTQLGGRER